MLSQRNQSQNELLLNNLLDFYNRDGNMEKMMNIINGESRTSLRIIDWFVTNFAKKNFTVYSIPAKNRCSTVYNGEENMERFKVFNSYKLELKAYSKIRFDPFSRRERIMIHYADDTFLETTIGQLNFFKWAIDNMVLEYIEENGYTVRFSWKEWENMDMIELKDHIDQALDQGNKDKFNRLVKRFK